MEMLQSISLFTVCWRIKFETIYTDTRFFSRRNQSDNLPIKQYTYNKLILVMIKLMFRLLCNQKKCITRSYIEGKVDI